MELNRRDVNTLSRFMQDRDRLSKKFNDSLRNWLVEHYGDLFRLDGQRCRFTADQKRRLKEELHKDYPRFNWLQGLTSGMERLAMASLLNQEKLADIRPDDQYVLVRQVAGDFSRAGVKAGLPPQISLRLPVDMLLKANPDTLVVVENLDVFDQWQQANVGAEILDSLVLYRGHNSMTRGVKSLLQQVPPQTRVVLFCDLDPKGLEMGFTTPGNPQLLLPVTLDEALALRSNGGIFKKQARARAFLQRQSAGAWKPWIDWVVKEHRAVMQQHLLEMQVPLEAVTC
ncbi:DUF7281 domain-containing protein [Bowmanella dokdonensis]|uniref:DUF7281 domain-containing protein n=1 Tax=Bowmanella dokdonensis TaxID=751969 RepID=A0A939DPY4_9ALTE|nr:hypothetical protein [Bowmanella dokdonensis]MBN7826212.1 hypothetical protein [Bowmanella dokdonensis]